MASAYQEALDRVQAGQDLSSASVPSYITDADTMNLVNGNKTFLDSAFDTLESIPKFIGVSMISGANQLYNIPADVGNLVSSIAGGTGEEFARSDTAEVISDLNSDLGLFYQDHREGADLVGFMLSSAVPGLGGVKLLNAGQKTLRTAITAGRFGEGTSRALGLLAPNKGKYLAEAIKELATKGSAPSLMNNNALKAIGSGIAQNGYEALAFETAVAATLFNSPVLENQDFGDFVSNVAWGAGIFGVLGGAIDATKIKFALKGAANSAAQEARPWTYIPEAAPKSSPYEVISMDLETLANMPSVLPGNTPELIARATVLQQTADATRATLKNRVRANMTVIAGGDQQAAEAMFHTVQKLNPHDQQFAMIGLSETGRLTTPAKQTAKLDAIASKIAADTATPEELALFKSTDESTGFLKVWGEDAGNVLVDAPVVTSLVDTLKKGQKVLVTKAGVFIGKEGGKDVPILGSKRWKFDAKYNVGAKAGAKGTAWDIYKADNIETNARYIWAQNLAPFKPTAKSPVTVHVNDLPLMEKVLRDVAPEDMQFVKFTGLDAKTGEEIGSDFLQYLGRKKVEVANKMLATKSKIPLKQEEIAARVNVKNSMLSGEMAAEAVGEYAAKDILAMQDHAATYTQQLIKAGLRSERDGIVPIWNTPQHMKLTYNNAPFAGLDNHVAEAMVIMKEQQKLYQLGADNAFASILGKDAEKFEALTSQKVYVGANPSGAGAGLLTAESENYGSLAASVGNIGRTTAGVINKFKDRSREVFDPLLVKLAQNKEAAIEFSTLNARVRNTQGTYGLNEAGDALESLALIKWRKAARAAQEAGEAVPKRPAINEELIPRINIRTQEAKDLIKAHIEVNGMRTIDLAKIRTAQGAQFGRDPSAFYPIPVDPRDYNHFAIVIDTTVTSGQHSKSLFANTAEQLEEQIRKMKENPHLKVLTKKEAENYYKSRGLFEYEKTINSNYLDTEALRKGASAPALPATDAQKITTDFLNWHLNRETGLVREAVSGKYEVQFEELRRLGDEFTNVATSKFSNSSISEYADDAVKNPFADYIKTALNVPKTTEYPLWVQPNKWVDDAVSAVYNKIAAVGKSAKSDADIAEIIRIQEQAGFKVAPNYDAQMDLFANATADKGVLSKVVGKANGILATIVLRLDTLNAVNNAISANVLLGAETKAVLRAIQRGDEGAVGALAKVMNIGVPGTKHSMKSGTKMVAEAMRKFNTFGPDSPEKAFYRENGFLTPIHDQYKTALDTITYDGREAISIYSNKLKKLQDGLAAAANKGEQWTGNRLAEEFNRFVAADVMKQMTDVAVQRNLMTAKEQLAYINTFVNRTQGNYLAAQRPMLFQGPLGQAIGLFQTYQFNLIQQMLRHVGEGHAKDGLTMLALQGSIHGMNGLPAFSAINTNLIGNASGNSEHKDLYDATYGAAGKQAGDWLMYGLASNMFLHPDLKVNLYTRGDINPRHLTIIPTDPSQVPIVQATGKFLANIFETAAKINAGGDVSTTLLQGLEHNSLSRPLAGLAQTLQGFNNPEAASFSTSNKGNVIAANDLLSLSNLTRMAGGKPLDEAIALDALYRFKAYGLRDAKKRQILGEAIKSTMIAGQDPTQEQVENFAQKYVETGGRQEEFNQWFGQLYTSANLSQTSKLQEGLNSPFTQSMQRLMGGKELRDFSQ